MLAALKEKHDQAVFSNFRRNRGSMFVRYSIELDGVWHPVDVKTSRMPKCIFTMPTLNIEFEFKNQRIFDLCVSPVLMYRGMVHCTSQNASILQSAVKNEGANRLGFTTTIYSDINSDSDTLFMRSTNQPDESYCMFYYGTEVIHPYDCLIKYEDMMGNMKGRLRTDPPRLTPDELADIAAYESALATSPDV